MSVPSADEVFDALRSDYAYRLAQQTTLIDLRRSGDEAVMIFRWPPNKDLFGVPVALTNTDQRMDWDRPATDLSDWLESVDLWIMEDVENGMHWRAARRRVDDYIELRNPGWPADDRFSVDVVDPGEDQSWLRTEFVARDGFDPSAANRRREDGTLLGWVTAYENNSTGSPYVAQATVVREQPELATIDTLEVAADAPVSLSLDVVRTAAHFAVDKGYASVSTRLEVPRLDIAGFRRDPASGFMVVDGSFLAEDVEAAQELLLADKVNTSRWGQDRDRAGRYLPDTRAGRMLHRLRHGADGSPRRTWVG